VSDYGDVLGRLSLRLSTNGFTLQRGTKAAMYTYELVATKVEFSALKGNHVHVIIVTTMDKPTTEEIESFSETA